MGSFFLLTLPSANEAGAVVRDGSIRVASSGDVERYRPSEILVKFKPSVTGAERSALHARRGGRLLKEFKGLRLHRIKLPAGQTVEDAVALYEMDPDVEYAQPNRLVEVLVEPNDPSFRELWGLRNWGQYRGIPGADIDAARAWNLTVGSPEVVVAVVDTGVDYNHPDLAGNIWTNPQEVPGNGIDDDGNGYVDDVHGINALLPVTDPGAGTPLDDHGHGTHVAGTIGAVGNNSIGVVGVSWEVKVIPCKFIGANGWGDVADAIECLEYVRGLRARGVPIVATNNSWGSAGADSALEDAVKAQAEAGILFVAGAANDAADIDRVAYTPAGIKMPNVLSVAATTSADELASFSNYGALGVHLAAPGTYITSTYKGGAYAILSGTSMAAPHVAGIAALLAAADPTRGAGPIRNLILTGAEPVASLAGRTLTGGRANAYQSLTCASSPLFSPTQYPTEAYAVGQAATLSAISVNCTAPVGPVTATSASGQAIELHDDGLSPDVVAGDGTFAGSWVPLRLGEQLTFVSPLGSTTVTAPLLDVVTSVLPEPVVGTPYSVDIEARGGIPPYTWSVTSGALPPTLSVSDSGLISGVAEDAGKFPLQLSVTDSVGNRHSRDFLLLPRLVSNLSLAWVRTHNYSSTPDEARAIAFGESGGLLVAGAGPFASWGPADDFVSKLDSEGSLVWTHMIPGASRDVGDGVATDGLGSIYVSGRTETSSEPRHFLAKYDDGGNLVWIRDQASALSIWATDMSARVSAAGPDAVYLTAPDYQDRYVTLTFKYDGNGNLLWASQYPTDTGTLSLRAIGFIADEGGNAYVVGNRADKSESTSECSSTFPTAQWPGPARTTRTPRSLAMRRVRRSLLTRMATSMSPGR